MGLGFQTKLPSPLSDHEKDHAMHRLTIFTLIACANVLFP